MSRPDEAGPGKLPERVAAIVANTPAFDIHTHLYAPSFGPLLLHGIDELLTYHYLVAEAFRSNTLSYRGFGSLAKGRQAEWIWEQLFLRQSPVSESCQGVLTTLNLLGLDPGRRDLERIRKWYAEQDRDSLVDRVFSVANVRTACMTNSPFDPDEARLWEEGPAIDPRFAGGLRIDPLLLDWPAAANRLREEGDHADPGLGPATARGIRKFLERWSGRIGARYLMASLPPSFAYPSGDPSAAILDEAVLPHCRDHGLPLALMIGVRRGVNPSLGLAGDGMGRADLGCLENLCAGHPGNRFLSTVLSFENQHELCVLARKFPNLHIFGCWWFTNIPLLVEEMTRMRLELVGLNLTPQHSDARVLDQLIYKWTHFREILSTALAGRYAALERTGWKVDDAEIRRDAHRLLGGAFEDFCPAPGASS